MRYVLRGLLALLLASTGSIARALPVEPAPAELRIDRFAWTAEPALAAALRRLVVRNDYGDIRARFAGDGVIAVSAVIQRLGPGPDIGVNVERHGDRLAVTVVAPPGRLAVDAERPGKTAIDRADLVIYVPEGVVLEAATLRGVVDARRLKSPIEATSGDGELRLETTQWVRAASSSGAVTVTAGRSAERPSLVETDSGAIWMSLVDAPDLRLEVETAGSVTSQIALAPRRSPDGRKRSFVDRDPTAQPVLVRSASGSVEIVRRAP